MVMPPALAPFLTALSATINETPGIVVFISRHTKIKLQ
jgi:hypothetical protein